MWNCSTCTQLLVVISEWKHLSSIFTSRPVFISTEVSSKCHHTALWVLCRTRPWSQVGEKGEEQDVLWLNIFGILCWWHIFNLNSSEPPLQQTSSNTLHYIHIEQLDKVQPCSDCSYQLSRLIILSVIWVCGLSCLDFREPLRDHGVTHSDVQHP